MKFWFVKFSRAVALSVITSIATFFAGVFVLRVLDPVDAGQYTLISSVATMVGLLGLFGQNSIINRTYARSAIPFHWQGDLLNTFLYSSVLISIFTTAVTLFYAFTWGQIAYVVLSAILTVAIYTSSSMLNSQRHYVWATFLLRLPNALLIIPVAIALIHWMNIDANGFLASQIIIGVACAVLGLVGLYWYMPPGDGVIPLEKRRDALTMFLMIGTHLLIDPGIIVVAGYFVSPSHIAALGGYFNLLRPFFLVWSISSQTLAVEFARNHDFPKRKLTIAVWSLAILLFFVGWVTLPFLLDFLYSGKYNMISSAALPISLLGSLLMAEIVPRSFLSGVSDSVALRRYVFVQVLSSLIALMTEVFLIGKFDVYGAVWGGVLFMLMRNLNAYIYFFRIIGQAKVT